MFKQYNFNILSTIEEEGKNQPIWEIHLVFKHDN